MLGVFVVAVDGACVFPEFGFEVTTRSGNVLSNDVGGALSPYAAELEHIAAEKFDVEGDIPCGDENCHYCNSFCDGDGASGNAFVTPAITSPAIFGRGIPEICREHEHNNNEFLRRLVHDVGTVARGTVEDYTNQPLGTPDATPEPSDCDCADSAVMAADVDDALSDFEGALFDFEGYVNSNVNPSTSRDLAYDHLDLVFAKIEELKIEFKRAKRLLLP